MYFDHILILSGTSQDMHKYIHNTLEAAYKVFWQLQIYTEYFQIYRLKHWFIYYVLKEICVS